MYEKPHLLTLPQEILESTLLLLDPLDIVACTKTCGKLRSLVYNERSDYMWRAIFLQLFDDPRERAEGEPVPDTVDWMQLLQSRIRAREVARSVLPANIPLHQDSLAVLPLILSDALRPLPSSSSTGALLLRPSKNVAFLLSLLHTPERLSALLGSPLVPAASRSPISSQLHTLFGLTPLDIASARIRGASRETVYSMRNYGLATFWGPFLPVHQVQEARRPDWALLESMMLVLGRNVRDHREKWNLPEEDMPLVSLERARPYTQVRLGGEEAEVHGVEGDWAGVQGRWYRIVSFMDYNDLWDWNWSGSGPKTLDDAYEVVKLMTLDLHITSIGQPPDDAVSDAREPSSPSFSDGSDGSDANSDSDFHPAGSAGSGSPDSTASGTASNLAFLEAVLAADGDAMPPDDDDETDETELVFGAHVGLGEGGVPHVHILHIPQITLHPGGFNMVSPADRLPRPASTSGSTSASGSTSSPRKRAKPHYPTIYFSGTSKGQTMDPPVTRLRGRVDMGSDGRVLWRLTSRFSGHAWVSEGVQVGGVQSQAGVLATWSELEHEEHGPAGPSWIWKSRSGTVAKERRDFIGL